MPAHDLVLHGQLTVVGPSGRELLVIEFEGATPNRRVRVRVLEVVDGGVGFINVVTSTSRTEQFEWLVGRVRRYMETLESAS